ncbi:MAG TPA: hypothetical protein VFG42_12220 [Baekduia sp.]|uniref:hypothetical protein n=1 Tax=Baekduia sp. TaxID=2600305 RepID=UPI002D76A2CF|nr:hypothetical protein [Baekduia sp.]HET6507545.1 hypothetical protein [Baekduia sp.]
MAPEADPTLVTTRRALHALAAQVIAPLRTQATGNEIALRPRPGGFGTPELPEGGWVGVDGTDLVRVDGEGARETAPITSLLDAADFVGLDDAASALTDAPLEVHAGAAQILADAWASGEEALIALGGDDTTPILWPEHFDIAIEHAQATYGVSPGDDAHPEPYAYISLWTPPPGLETGPSTFWNAVGFTGAERPWTNDVDELVAFFRAGAAAR